MPPKKQPTLSALLSALAGVASLQAAVPSADITLQPPVIDNLPVISVLSAFTATEALVIQPNKQTPLFAPYDNKNDAWWDNLISEQLQARLPVVMLSVSGSNSTNPTDLQGNGGMPGQRLIQYIRALDRAGGTGKIKFGCFAPSAAQGIYRNVYGLPAGTLYDFANEDAWDQVWWQRILKPWLDTVPQAHWYKINNRLPVQFWGLGIKTIYKNQQGNVSRMVNFLDAKMQAEYGVGACFIMGTDYDTTLSACPSVLGDNGWFSPPGTSWTMTPYKGKIWGGLAAGYIDPAWFDPASPKYHDNNRVLRRNLVNGTGQNGDTLKDGLAATFASSAVFTGIEAWTNVSESNGLYRGAPGVAEWDFPNQYINILRSHTDLRTITVRLDAEAADAYSDSTPGNTPGDYRRAPADLDVRALTGAPAITASLENAPYQYAKDAFDGLLFTKWYAPAAAPGWLAYDYGSGNSEAANAYYVTTSDFALATALARAPKDWTLQASNDGVTWVNLHTPPSQTWTATNETRKFTFTNTVKYRRYRLNVTATQGGGTNGIALSEFRLLSNASSGGGWAVTNTTAGEWVEFKDVYFSAGNYTFPVRYSATSARTLALSVDGVALPNVVVPSTGGAFDTVSLGLATLPHGFRTLRVTFVDGGAELDWLFAKKTDPLIALKASNNFWVCAEKGGRDIVVANRTGIGGWEKFSANDTNGGTLQAGDTITLQVANGLYLSAANGGGGALLADELDPAANEQFTLVKTNGGTGPLVVGDTVALRTASGSYLTLGAASKLDATGSSIGANQTFTLDFRTQ